jgi:hypothetical protein
MGEADFLEQFDLVIVADADGGGGVFADAVDGEDGGVFEGGRVEGAGGVGFVMEGEEDGAIGTEVR